MSCARMVVEDSRILIIMFKRSYLMSFHYQSVNTAPVKSTKNAKRSLRNTKWIGNPMSRLLTEH